MANIKRDRTQRELLNAAANIIKNEGYEKITVRHLGQVTGFSHTVFYHYFKNLNALLSALRLEMIEDMMVELGNGKNESDDRSVDQIEKLISVFTRYADYYISNPNVFRFFYFYPFSDLQQDMESRSLESAFQSIWQESFAGLVKEGAIKEEEVFTVAKTIIYAVSGMLLLAFTSSGEAASRETTKTDIGHEIRQSIQFLFRSIK